MAEIPTIWQPSGNQEGEYTQSTAVDIMDPAANSTLLVDPSGTFIVDTGVAFTPISGTTWSADDGA